MDKALKQGLILASALLASACVPPGPRVPVEQAPPPATTPPPVQTPPAPPPVRSAPAQSPEALPTPEAIPPSQPSQPTAPPPVAGSAIPALPPAAKALSAKADAAAKAGRYDEAAAHLERALRIAPRHPVLWHDLAVVRYRQKDYDKVEGLAMRSNSYANGADALRKSNWELIATVRRLRGDVRGADAARVEARRFVN